MEDEIQALRLVANFTCSVGRNIGALTLVRAETLRQKGFIEHAGNPPHLLCWKLTEAGERHLKHAAAVEEALALASRG